MFTRSIFPSYHVVLTKNKFEAMTLEQLRTEYVTIANFKSCIDDEIQLIRRYCPIFLTSSIGQSRLTLQNSLQDRLDALWVVMSSRCS